MQLLQPNPGLIFWQIIVFGSLVFLLYKFAWKGILAGLKEREGEIHSALKMAEETRAEMAKLKSDNERSLAEARKEREAIIKEAREAASRLVSEAKEKANLEGQRLIADARETIAHDRAKLVSELKKDVATLSIGIAEKVLRRELSEKKNQQVFVDELIADAKLN